MNIGGRWDRSLPYWLQDITQCNNTFLHTHTFLQEVVTLKKQKTSKQTTTKQLQLHFWIAEGDGKTSIWPAEIVVVFQPASSLLPFLIFILSSLTWISKLLKVTLLLHGSVCLTYVERIPPRKSQVLTAPTVPQGSPADHSSLQSHSFPCRWPGKKRNPSLSLGNS